MEKLGTMSFINNTTILDLFDELTNMESLVSKGIWNCFESDKVLYDIDYSCGGFLGTGQDWVYKMYPYNVDEYVNVDDPMSVFHEGEVTDYKDCGKTIYKASYERLYYFLMKKGLVPVVDELMVTTWDV
jgi:hypothetical protein